jgi:transcriptional regulator with XRE-family HTH domain
MPNKIHEGRNIKRFREMLGIKQEALAMELGDDWTQKKISLLEQKDSVEPLLLQQVADVLKIPAEVFKNFDEEQAVNIIANTIDNGAIGYQRNDACTFNPIDMLVQLHEEKIALYERMLKEKDALIERFERMVGSKK